MDITYSSSKSSKYKGKITKRIKVHSNDSSNSMMEIKIKAQANTPGKKFEWLPDKAEFDEILIGKKAKFKLELTNKDSSDAHLIVVSEPTNEYVKKYKIKKDKLKPDQGTQIEFELQKNLPPGVFRTALTLQMEDRPDTRITIPITGKVVEKLSEKKDKPETKDKTKAKASTKKPPVKKAAKTTAVSKEAKAKVSTKLDSQ
ncbi:MAG: hypothetical protein GY839_20785 [candidate division Zixibacteria bacterium]|nr:hypothetical protein [candidate division Zixibacteria bacterium]